ncbi:MAG: hypothetical protein ACRC4L_01580 [Mycoplasma sp.]
MKRYLNYLLLFANLLIVLMSAITIFLFIPEFEKQVPINQVYQNLKPTIWIPIVAVILSSAVIGFYFFCLKKEISKQEFPLNPRLISSFKNIAILTFLNLLCSPLLTLVGILIIDESGTTALLWTSLALSMTFGLVMSGYVSYLNLRISYSNVQREALMTEAIEENEKIKDQDKDKSDVDYSIKRKPVIEDQITDTSIDQPTSGSFK